MHPRNANLERQNATGMKRKAEYQLRSPPKARNQQGGSAGQTRRHISPAAKRDPSPNKASPVQKHPAIRHASRSVTPGSSKPGTRVPGSNPPPRQGSFAELMLKAKSLQEAAPTTVGTLKHQAAPPKGKVSKVQRKRRILDSQAKDRDSRLGKNTLKAASATGGRPNPSGASRAPDVSSYKGTSRPTQLRTAQPGYRGTAGLPSRYGTTGKKEPSKVGGRSRQDEYLATDEEDEGDYADDYDDYYSEESDMEAGMEDVEEEEEAALSAARKEDEREWQAELASKKEKIERQKKLTALAAKKGGR